MSRLHGLLYRPLSQVSPLSLEISPRLLWVVSCRDIVERRRYRTVTFFRLPTFYFKKSIRTNLVGWVSGVRGDRVSFVRSFKTKVVYGNQRV